MFRFAPSNDLSQAMRMSPPFTAEGVSIKILSPLAIFGKPAEAFDISGPAPSITQEFNLLK